jgi:predicted RNase H-like HicB family nuclease
MLGTQPFLSDLPRGEVLRLLRKEAKRLENMRLTAVFEQVRESEGGGYLAYTEELPGAISEGDTLDEARDNLWDAVKVLLATGRAHA